jgi:hypothetical protein
MKLLSDASYALHDLIDLESIFHSGYPSTIEELSKLTDYDEETDNKAYAIESLTALLDSIQPFIDDIESFDKLTTDQYTLIRKLDIQLLDLIHSYCAHQTQQDKRIDLLKHFNVHSFDLPQWAVTPLLYGDESGIDEDDIYALEQFLKDKIETLPNYDLGHWGSVPEETFFTQCHDMRKYDVLACECVTIEYLIPKEV